MSGAKVALKSIPGRGITVDGVVAVMQDDTLIVRQKVKDGTSILKGQAVAFDTAHMTVRTTVTAEAGVFAGIAHSSGTMDTAIYDGTIPMISVVRGPVGRGVQGEDLAAAVYAKAGADGLFYIAADFATSHARIRRIANADDFNGNELQGVDLEFDTVGK
ncbi:MAG: hypothetical protein DRH37_11380 [Deltaproteobacteria bacterium]|nr:MAG: hypothetical protein DRH37_11380 [Deltaproteobacteria bacterium]